MVSGFKRKFGRLVADPVLRRWLVGRALGRNPRPPAFHAHVPPYAEARLPLVAETPATPPMGDQVAAGPAPDVLPLAGSDVSYNPSDPSGFVTSDFDDIETELALHRFAWLPLVPAESAAAVLNDLWPAWCARFAKPDEHWAWHPYTAAERAINVLDAMRRGIGPVDPNAAAVLACHAPAIAARLEYFGEHDTSNHLANDGRGLYRLGCDLGLEEAAALGRDILLAEAARLYLESGMLREGSSHYHLLYLRNYLDAFLCALRHGRNDEAAAFADIVVPAAGAARVLTMPGRFPLVGDISPDCPPEFLTAILLGRGGWLKTLDAEARQRVGDLVDSVSAPDADKLEADGWIRLDAGDWSALWYAAPGGWPPMPGHAHQDMGAAELHFRDEAVFVDPGRGRYGQSAEAGRYASAAVHGTLTLDGADPYPANKPYYDDAFRERVADAPVRRRFNDGVEIRHGGYRRLGVGNVVRRWQFGGNGLTIDDAVEGRGRHRIERALVTPLPAKIENGAVVIDGERTRYRVAAGDAKPRLEPVTVWSAYGRGAPGSRIVFAVDARLSWRGSMTIEAGA